MKIKGRRQSSNVNDVRDPVANARHAVRTMNQDFITQSLDEEIKDRELTREIQSNFGNPVAVLKEELNRRILQKRSIEFDEMWDAQTGQRVQADVRGMEMLLGPRWKD